MANNEKEIEIKSNFVPPQERMVQPGLESGHEDRPVVRGENFFVEPGRVFVGRIDTTKQTLK